MTWRDALERARDQKPFTDRLKRRCHELQNITLTFTQDYHEPLRTVRGLGWHYPSDEELASIMLAEHDQHLYTYSEQIHEQLPGVVQLLRDNPNTRRAVIHLTDQRHAQRQEHLPCMIAVYAAVRDDKLHLTTYARSIDLFIGLPANLYQSHELAKHLAGKLSIPVGSVTFLINSAHIFDDYEEELTQVLER